MSNSEAVQAARKTMQLARLEAKGKKNYPTYYANQPAQVVKAKKNEELRAARASLKDAAEALEIATITGEGLATAQETQAIAAIVVERLTPASNAAAASLSGA